MHMRRPPKERHFTRDVACQHSQGYIDHSHHFFLPFPLPLAPVPFDDTLTALEVWLELGLPLLPFLTTSSCLF